MGKTDLFTQFYQLVLPITVPTLAHMAWKFHLRLTAADVLEFLRWWRSHDTPDCHQRCYLMPRQPTTRRQHS